MLVRADRFRVVFDKIAGAKAGGRSRAVFTPKTAIFICAVEMLSLLVPQTRAATSYTWTSSVSGNWSNGANWLGGVPPAVDPNADTNLEFNAPGTYTSNNDLGPFGLYNLTFDAGNGTTTLNGGDINLTYPSNEVNNPTFADNSTNPVIINNNVNFTAPPADGGTPQYFVLQPGATTTINGVVSLTGGSSLKMTNGEPSGPVGGNLGGPGGTMIWTQPVNFTNSPPSGFSGYFPFRIYEGTFEMAGYTIADGASNGSGVHNVGGVNILYSDGHDYGATTDMYIGPEDYENGDTNDVVGFYLVAGGNNFNARVQVGDAGTTTIGGKNTSGTVTFNNLFLTLPSDGNGIINGKSQVIYYSAAAGGTVLQNFQLVRGGGSGYCAASVDKIGAGTWIVAAGGTNNTGEQAYHGTTTVRDGTLELAYDDTGTGVVNLPAAAVSDPNTFNYYSSGLNGGSLGFNAPTDPNPANDTNAVQLGDSGTLSTDNIAFLTLNNAGAPGPRQVLHNLVVNTFNSGGTTTIGVGDNGTGNFTGNILLNKTVVLTGGTGGTANFSGVLNGSGGVTVNGTGTVNFSAPEIYSGPTAISQGTLMIATSGSIINSAITVGSVGNTGKLTFAANTTGTLARNVVSLTVNSTGVVTEQAGTGRSVVIVNSNYSNSGKIDLANNDMIVKGGGASGLTAINAQLKSGLNIGGATWQGATGIESSVAAADTSHIMAIGAIQNVNGTVPLYGSGGGISGTFDGQTTLGTTDILIKYTYFGDANLDGKVDGSDYARIDAGYISGGTKTGWLNGDFNYDGKIDGSDYTLIDNAFNRQSGQISSAAMIATETAQIATSGGAVPEPTAVGLLGVGALSLLSRHHKRRLR